METKLTPRTIEDDLLKKVERLEVFEERFKMYFDKISINVINDSLWFDLLCEVYPKNGTTFENTFMVYCVLYDKDNKILREGSNYILADQFFGFEVIRFNFYDYDLATRVEKIRLYPQN